MTVNDLYEIAEQSHIRIDEFKLDEDTNSLAVYFDGAYAIALNLNKIKTRKQLITAFAHELGHCQTHSFYNVYSKFDVRSKHEHRADRWAIEKLLPIAELEEALEKGYVEKWQLADYFEVTEDLIKKAFWIYFYKEI